MPLSGFTRGLPGMGQGGQGIPALRERVPHFPRV